jgi:hypothetical protein
MHGSGQRFPRGAAQEPPYERQGQEERRETSGEGITAMQEPGIPR